MADKFGWTRSLADPADIGDCKCFFFLTLLNISKQWQSRWLGFFLSAWHSCDLSIMFFLFPFLFKTTKADYSVNAAFSCLSYDYSVFSYTSVLSGNVSSQPTTKKEIELQVIDVPSIITLQRPFTVIYDPMVYSL